MYRSLLSAVLSLSVLLSTLVAAQDAEYTFTTLDVPLLGAIDTDAYAVNDSRQVVGAYRDSRIVWHGFLYQGGSFTEVTVGSCTQLFAYGINNSGEIVGLCQNAAGSHAFFKAPTGEETIYDAPEGTTTQPSTINEDGDMAGLFSSTDDPVIHGVFTDATHWTSNVAADVSTVTHCRSARAAPISADVSSLSPSAPHLF